jgi:hypothetical protein
MEELEKRAQKWYLNSPLIQKDNFRRQSDTTFQMETEKTDINELSEKIMRGLKMAIKKLVEDTAAQNGSLVIGDKDGNILYVPAKDLLHTVQDVQV